MKAALKANSLASAPDKPFQTLFWPFGAPLRTFLMIPSKSLPGKLPMAGLSTKALIISGDLAASIKAGLL
ncbi:hypothetical protein WICPIJ_000820 [Wickerhamomyces pijperi]|uniref:Uncharacterized protein n=1 Tax=Wickerhamomyces pijperi TaxID=599730 RepID=A0A9P8QC22_WICPI|nr:hypothetical protein WICPIJ_000820 [Wickerhamomyces pijperi]